MTSIETQQLPRTNPQPRTEERNKNLLKRRPKPVKKTLKDRSSVTSTSKNTSTSNWTASKTWNKTRAKAQQQRWRRKAHQTSKGRESERERRETTPRAEGQRAAVFSFSPFPEIPHYRDKKPPPRWMTNLIFMNINSHLCWRGTPLMYR